MNRLRELREEKKLYQKDIAAFLKMNQSNYSKYELEKVSIPIEVLAKLADFYDTSVDYLLYRTDKKEPYRKAVGYKG